MDLIKWKQYVMDLLFPHYCVGCDTIGSPFCTQCLAIVPLRDPGCLACSARNHTGTFCASCKRHVPYLTRVVWAVPYEIDSITRAILQFKYHGNRALADPLGAFIVTSLKKRVQEYKLHIPQDASLLPVPLHTKRYRERGYNQSVLLAFFLHQTLALPMLPESTLLRIKNTSPQAQCIGGRDARRKNIENAFWVPQSAYSSIRGKTILLVDDIATTGSTLNDAARALKTAGARQIWGTVVAKG